MSMEQRVDSGDSLRARQDILRAQDKQHTIENGRCGSFYDSGNCDSFRSQTDSLDSVGSRLSSESVPSSKSDSLQSKDSGFSDGNISTPSPQNSLHQQLEKLQIAEPCPEEVAAPVRFPDIITLAQLKARTKEQKLKDLASYDFGSFCEPKSSTVENDEERCDSGLCDSSRCSSLIEEEDIPPQFQQDTDGDTFCHLAIVHRQDETIIKIIESCPSWRLLNIQNELGQTPLHLATLTNQPLMVRRLLCWGAAVDIRDRMGNTPLHIASREGFFDCVLALTRRLTHSEIKQAAYNVPFQRIPQGADLQNYAGETCVQLAACGPHFEILNHLIIECRANINTADWKSGRTLLHRAVEANAATLVEFLLSHPRIDVDLRTYEGYTALQLAMGRRHTDIIQLLLVAGAEHDGTSGPTNSASSSSEDEEENMDYGTDEDVDDGYDDIEYLGQSVSLPR